MTTQELWQSQSIDLPRITAAYLRGRADDTVRDARKRNLVEYGSAVAGLVVATWIWSEYTDAWMRTGAVLWAFASVIYTWCWRRMATPAATPADLGALDTLSFHRRELERQYSAYRGSWRWVVPLYLPAVASLMYGSFMLSGPSGAKLAFMIAVGISGFAVGTWITESRAAKLRREIELLDLMAK